MHQRTASLASFVSCLSESAIVLGGRGQCGRPDDALRRSRRQRCECRTEARPFATLKRPGKRYETSIRIGRRFRGGAPRGHLSARRTHSLLAGGFRDGRTQRDLPSRAHEMAVLSGGRPITGWQADTGKRWKAKTDLENFRQLYVGGVRAVAPEAANWATTRMPAAGSSCTISCAAAVCRMPKPWETWATAPPRWKWPRGATFPTSSSAMSE